MGKFVVLMYCLILSAIVLAVAALYAVIELIT